MNKVAIRSVLVLILLGTALLGSSCSSTGESGLTLADDRPNLLFFHSEY